MTRSSRLNPRIFACGRNRAIWRAVKPVRVMQMMAEALDSSAARHAALVMLLVTVSSMLGAMLDAMACTFRPQLS